MFDLDGTLIDSKTDIAESVNRALARMDVPSVPVAKIAEFVGNGVRVLIQRVLAEALAAEAEPGLLQGTMNAYLEAYEAHLLDSTTLYPGVRDSLDSLGWAEMAVITNKPESFSRKILEALGIAGHFRIVLGGDSSARRKPDPAPLESVMAKCGAAAIQTVMVGDSQVDVVAGKAAGVFTCGISGGFRPRAELELAGCDLIVGSVGEMPPFFCPAL
jgi:phosphoglycolate phosphatase